MKNKITIPDEFYVGFHKEHPDTTLAFLTPNGNDSSAIKRKSTVDSWAAKQYYDYDKKEYKGSGIPSKVIKNELLSGYKIAESVRRIYWGGGNVVWRIEDPRGFEFEISSANFANILSCTTIINGVISGKCILGREKANNILLPENSTPYIDAVNTTNAKKSVVIKKQDIPIGANIVLNNSTEGIYLGMVNVIYREYLPVKSVGEHVAEKLQCVTCYGYIHQGTIILRKDIKIISFTSSGLSYDDVNRLLKNKQELNSYGTAFDSTIVQSYSIVAVLLENATEIKLALSDKQYNADCLNVSYASGRYVYEKDNKLYCTHSGGYFGKTKITMNYIKLGDITISKTFKNAYGGYLTHDSIEVEVSGIKLKKIVVIINGCEYNY